MIRHKYSSVDEFVNDFAGTTRERLEILRRVIAKELPMTATEKISYNIPTFTLDPKGKGYLIYFAGYANHTSIYPIPKMVPKSFEKEIATYKKGKGTMQFPHDKPLPIHFIRQVVKYLVDDYYERNPL